jgi:hypothetical protein
MQNSVGTCTWPSFRPPSEPTLQPCRIGRAGGGGRLARGFVSCFTSVSAIKRCDLAE